VQGADISSLPMPNSRAKLDTMKSEIIYLLDQQRDVVIYFGVGVFCLLDARAPAFDAG
jgi:hypothetical protein